MSSSGMLPRTSTHLPLVAAPVRREGAELRLVAQWDPRQRSTTVPTRYTMAFVFFLLLTWQTLPAVLVSQLVTAVLLLLLLSSLSCSLLCVLYVLYVL